MLAACSHWAPWSKGWLKLSKSVKARPPTRSCASSTIAFNPASRAAWAAAMPAAPAPMMIRSYSLLVMGGRRSIMTSPHDFTEKRIGESDVTCNIVVIVSERHLRSRRGDRVPDAAVGHERATRIDHLGVDRVRGLGAGRREARLQAIARARPHAEGAPVEAMLPEDRLQPVRQPVAQAIDPRVVLRRQHVFKGGLGRGDGDGAAIGRAAGRQSLRADVDVEMLLHHIG